MNGGRNHGFGKAEDARAHLRLADRKEEMGDGKSTRQSTRTEAVETDGLRRWPDGWILLGFAGLPTAVALVPSSCGGQEGSVGPAKESPSPGEEAESAGRAAGVSVADATDDPDKFYGKKATLSGLVAGKVGPDSIAIGGEAFGGAPVLIVGAARKLERVAEGLPDSEVAEIRQRYLAEVTGKLREFDVQEVEEEVGHDLDDDVLAGWEDEPVPLAEEVVLTPRRDGDSARARQGADATPPLIAPEEFYGHSVTAKGDLARVLRVLDRNVYLIVDGRLAQEEEVFDDVDGPGSLAERGVLVATNEGPAPAEQQVVWVTGRVLGFDVADLERRLGASFDEDAEVLSTNQENEGPVVLASEVRRQTRCYETTGR